MIAQHRAIGCTELAAAGQIFVHVEDVPGQADDMLRTRFALGQNRADVFQGLLRLRDEALWKFLVLVPADHAADKHELAARLDAVGVAFRRGPAGRLQRLMLGGSRWQSGHGSGRHGHSPYEASFRDAPSAARRRNSKRCSFPVCVFGSSVTNSMARGYLYGATVALTWS